MFLTGERMTLLQKEAVRMGNEEHLEAEALAVYADPHLNYLKMETLRSALSDGISPAALKPIAKPWIPVWQMRDLIDEVKCGNVPDIPHRPFPIKALVSTAAMAVLLAPLPFLAKPAEEPVLELNGEEIRLSCGSQFDPAAYVKNTNGTEAELILPDAFTAEKPGSRLVQYRMEKGGKTIRRNLRITVTDDTAPVLKLKTEKTELLRETPFSCHSYVFSAEDNVDADLKNSVNCSDVLQDKETQTVKYTVRDSAGNEASALLEVHFADYPAVLSSDETAETETPLRKETVTPPALPRSEPTPPPVIEPLLS